MSKVVHASGKRKSAIAKATLREGTGRIRINKIDLENFSPKMLQMRLKEPLILAGDISKTVDINVKVTGGGITGQADAARLAISKTLVQFSRGERLRKLFLDYDRQLLVADVRRNETSKPNDSKPRAKRQKSYR